MPKTRSEPVDRTNIRIPTAMIREIKRIVDEFPELYNNRQQFIESAIREKILQIKLIAAKVKVQP